MKRSLPRRKYLPRKGSTGSRAWCPEAKAIGRGEDLGMQPRRTLRRRGRGTVRQPSWEQERTVSAPAVRSLRCHLKGGLGASSPISGIPVKVGKSGAGVGAAHTVPKKRGNARGWEGAVLGLRVRGR